MASPLRFTVYFDGTGNNKDLHTPEGTHTNVARLYELDTAKGTNLAYNSQHARQTYNSKDCSGGDEKIYFDGVGSQPGKSALAAIECGSGRGGQERIDTAYNSIVAFHNKYPGSEVQVNMVGFSRGAAQARALSNEFITKGVPELDVEGKPTGKYLISPGAAKVNKLALFDTVASYGNALSDSHRDKDLQIHTNVQSTTHLVAMNEYRKTFRLTSALRSDNNEKIEELHFAGAHSQVGGSYRNDDLAAGPLAVMHERMTKAGIGLAPLKEEDRERAERYNQLIESPEAIRQALIDSRLKHGNEAFRKAPDGSLEKVDNTAFILEKGSFYSLGRQEKPFDHEVDGRGVVFEFDDSLSKSALTRLKQRLLGERFEQLEAKFKDQYSETPQSSRSVESRKSENKSLRFTELEKTVQQEAKERTAALFVSLRNSRPDANYISSLNLPRAPLSVLTPVSPVKYNSSVVMSRIEELKEINKQFSSLEREPVLDDIVRKGTLIDVTMRHESVKSGGVDGDEIKEMARHDLEIFVEFEGKPEQQALARSMGSLMDNRDYREFLLENSPENVGITIEASKYLEGYSLDESSNDMDI